VLIDFWTLFVVHWLAVPVGVFAFVHALMQRADAYSAADRLTKRAWVGITGAGAIGLLLFYLEEVTSILWLASLVAVLVYIVDVRPKLTEVQRGPRW
jgi:hypothetical protein